MGSLRQFFKNFNQANQRTEEAAHFKLIEGLLVYTGETTQQRNGVTAVPWHQLARYLAASATP